MTTKTTAFTDCRFCGSEIGAHDQFCGSCGKKQHPDHKAIISATARARELAAHGILVLRQ